MLTQEQIKNLKPGDPVIMHGTFDGESPFGNIIIKHKEQMLSGISPKSRVYVHPSAVSLPSEHGASVPTPKHDPCRLFKGGDKVKRRTVDGRTDIDVSEGIDLTVTSDEDSHGNVHVKEPWGRSIVTKSVFLELLTPVEELNPYTIELGISGKGTDYRIKKDGVIICAYSCAHPNAEAAAKAEHARLNEEWRKNRAQ